MGPPLEWSTPPSILGTCSFLRSSMRDRYLFRGRRMCFPSAVDFTYGHRFQYPLTLVFVFRGVSAYRGGRTCFPTAFEYEDIFNFSYFFHFIVLVYAVHMQLLSVFPFLSFKWRGQAFDLCRPSVFSCTAELDWTSWPVAFLRPMRRTPADTGTGCPCCLGFR